MAVGDGIPVLQVPVVDISSLVAVENDADLNAAVSIPGGPLSEIIDPIRAAAADWVFFYISNHQNTD